MNNNLNFWYLSVDHYKYEWFRSWALISVREILRHLKKMWHNADFFSIAHKSSLVLPTSYNIFENIWNYKWLDIHEVQIWEKKSIESIDSIFQKIIEKFDLDIILIESPSVELRNFDLYLLQIIQKYSKKVLMLIQDELYPNYSLWRDENLVCSYLNEMRKIRLICPTENHKDLINKTIWLTSKVIPNIIDIESIITKEKSSQYITIINPIKLKGISIFEEIAKRLPYIDFLTVESWKQEKPYSSQIENIKTMNYTKNPSEIYEKTKILLVPSLIKEWWPRVIIEALLNNIPVIWHDIWGIKDAWKWLIHLIPQPLNIQWSTIEPEISKKEISIQANIFVKKIIEILEYPSRKDTSSIIIESNKNSILTLENFINEEVLFVNSNKKYIQEIKNYLKENNINIENVRINLFANWNRNNLYIIYIDSTKYLCRINHIDSDTKSKKLNTREIKALNEIKDLKIWPKLLFTPTQNNSSNSMVILEYIEGNIIDKINNSQIKLLAKQLSKLHWKNTYNYHWFIWEKQKYIDYNHTIILDEHYWIIKEICLKNNLNNESNELLIDNIYKKLKKLLEDCDYKINKYVITHWDLKKDNIVFSENSVKFIDWECSHIDIPEIDLARIISTYWLDNNQINLFLNYYKSNSDININIIFKIKKVFDFLSIVLKYKYSWINNIVLLEKNLKNFFKNN